MEILADLLMASPEDIPTIVASEYPLGSFRGVNIDGLDPLMLVALQASVSGQAFDSLTDLYHPVAQASENGPWLIQIPSELTEHLAGLQPPDYPAVARGWTAVDTPTGVELSTTEAEKFLGQMAYLAQTAVFDGKHLFLWVYS
ncbi:MAG: hypothetical protein P8X64_00125 [Anaerolineales bacterium]|jgi:hypothetical protein